MMARRLSLRAASSFVIREAFRPLPAAERAESPPHSSGAAPPSDDDDTAAGATRKKRRAVERPRRVARRRSRKMRVLTDDDQDDDDDDDDDRSSSSCSGDTDDEGGKSGAVGDDEKGRRKLRAVHAARKAEGSDREAAPVVFVPPHLRMVPVQEHPFVLGPHATVRDNVSDDLADACLISSS